MEPSTRTGWVRVCPHHDAFTVVMSLLDGNSFARLQSTDRACRNVLRGYEAAFYATRVADHAWFFGELAGNDCGGPSPALSRYLRLRASSHRILVIGGSSNRGDQDQYLSSVEEFSPATAPLSPSATVAPPLLVARDACALAVSSRHRHHAVFAVGGWDGDRALATVESLRPEGSGWEMCSQRLVKARCFTASVVAGDGTLLVFGGGEHLYQGAEVFTSTEASSAASGSRPQGPFNIRPELRLLAPRTGHCCAINRLTNQVLVVAGYGGGSIYRQTAELLDLTGWRPKDEVATSAGENKESGNSLFQPLSHQLSQPRTGCVGGFGPHGAFYCCGGSTDGGDAVSLLERLDLREPTGFELRAPMAQRRGYFSGCFALDGRLYVSGGSHLMPAELHFHEGVPHIIRPQVTENSIECYDPRMDRWETIDQTLMTERADHQMGVLLQLNDQARRALVSRANPVVDVWQRRSMMTL